MKELNYLSEKIEELESDRDFMKGSIRKSNYKPLIEYKKIKLGFINEELEILKSILEKIKS